MAEEIEYRIEGLSPSSHMSIGNYGFRVLLERNIAERLLKIPYIKTERVSQLAQNTLDIVFGKERLPWKPYAFMKMSNGELSNLIFYCTVPGDACSLGIDFGDIDANSEMISGKKYVIYTTHNVDSPTQAYALLSLWLQWMNTVHVLFKG